jgi:hypothetical protein
MIAENMIADHRNPGMSHRPNRRRRRVRRNGYALVIVTMLILTMSGLAAVHQRNLNSALRVEQARMESEAYRLGPMTVLAHAIDLLKAGDAPAPVSYSYSHTVGSTTTLYRVSYALSGKDKNNWNVTVDPDPSAAWLADLPDIF